MKYFFAFAASLTLLYVAPTFAKKTAAFENNPNAFVIDKSDFKTRVDEEIIVINQTNSANASFRIWGFDFESFDWIVYGSVEFKKMGQKKKVKKLSKERDLDEYRFIAIESSDGQKASFSWQEDDNDLIIIAMTPND